MRRLSTLLSAIVLAFLAFDRGPVVAGQDEDCRADFLRHLRASPDGLAIYAQVRQPGFFEGWIRCDDAQLDLPTAVHESTHVIAAETDAFPLIGGGAVARPHDVSNLFPPHRIAKSFAADDLVSTYLRRGRATSSTDFLYLLDELNAYSHDLNTAVDLKDMKRADETVDHRDGVSAMMAFVAAYAETARAEEPATWRGLFEPRAREAVSQLWSQAERVLASSCGIPSFGHSDRYYIGKVCAAGAQAAISEMLGRAPACPKACLQAALEDEMAGAETVTTPFVAFRPGSRRRTVRSKGRTRLPTSALGAR